VREGRAARGAFRATRDPSTGNCYLGFRTGTSWTTAVSNCANSGGYLAVIQSSAENLIARAATDANVQVWIGFHDLGTEAGNNASGFEDIRGGAGASSDKGGCGHGARGAPTVG